MSVYSSVTRAMNAGGAVRVQTTDGLFNAFVIDVRPITAVTARVTLRPTGAPLCHGSDGR